MTTAAEVIVKLTRHVPHFPSEGVQFADLTPVFADPQGLKLVIDELARLSPVVDIVAGIDARGFLLGSAVAVMLGTGVLAVRKAGKLPPPVYSQSYALEYGESTLEIPAEGINLKDQRVLVIDDVLATGGTALATVGLLKKCGAQVVAVAVVLELADLGGREKVDPTPVLSLAQS
ncbi:MAG: adenine phosphoribosyltransferase [Mycobacteriaceae bacterium]